LPDFSSPIAGEIVNPNAAAGAATKSDTCFAIV